MRWVDAALSLLVCLTLAGCSEPERLPVPDVRGELIAVGAEHMQSLGLCVDVVQGSGPDRGFVIDEQRPRPGVDVAEGTVVDLVTSTVANIADELRRIGIGNRELGCSQGIGTPADEDEAG